MKIVRINHRQLASICAVFAVTLVLGAAFIGATARVEAEPDLRSDLSSEVRALESYADDLAAFKIECARLNKKPSVIQTEIDPIQRKADDLKRRLSGFQNAVGEVIRKLKAANAWDDLDAKLLANITDPRERAFFQESSFKRDLEEAASSLSSRSSDINVPLDILRRKLTSQTLSPYEERGYSIIRVSYSPPAPMKFVSLDCTVHRVRFGIIRRLGGMQTNASCNAMGCACNPDASITNCSIPARCENGAPVN